MKTMLLIVVLAIGLTACGVKGDPELPGSTQKTGKTQQSQ